MQNEGIRVGLLTGGSDKPYALGLAGALEAEGLSVDFVGSDELDCPEVRQRQGITFLNLRGDQSPDASLLRKATRVVTYYARLVAFASAAEPRILHILWNNRFELVDRILLMLYYRLTGKRVVLTAHNVNIAKRDSTDSWVNRLSLKIQYRLCHHIFVHTHRMKQELAEDFGVVDNRITVIPFGVNHTIPTSGLTPGQARECLGLQRSDKTLLFFGQIAPYKGVEYLIAAMACLVGMGIELRLIIAGKVKRGCEDYAARIRRAIVDADLAARVMLRMDFVPDEQVEPYFRAADAVVLPYVDIFQSGLPFLAFSFGVPVIATDVGSLYEDVIADKTGLVCPPRDAPELARTIERYFCSDLYRQLDSRRQEIQAYVTERHSWTTVGETTKHIYERVLSCG